MGLRAGLFYFVGFPLALVAGFAGTAVATVAAFATGTVAFTAGTTLATVTTFATGTVATGCALALYVSFGFGLEGTHGETIFAGLLVNLDELDFYLVAFLEAGCLHVFETLP